MYSIVFYRLIKFAQIIQDPVPFLTNQDLTSMDFVPFFSLRGLQVVSVNSSYFTQLFGLPLSHLYEAMDPLTTVPGGDVDGR